ncbi:hypothetical protein [Lysinibacillus fusiformis]|uniref:hypothetical protein n=1 Tax=Lysinibacillus fusiformis TaxID=28031 RepID=UPI000885E47E|nr:hypothetical protein [Lysinibacillus fusiformis]SCX62214.1 hypothetical protein SAMN02787108_03042 [Lysinibacillus fusiformis]SDB44100.1 hypothetical protein SAMN02787070_03253 [Lysinibacillus fusiformis]SFI65458.1 hypothetical protein SAMN02787080_03270 [Lysinibacillus fusiformis]SFT12408.1 hypothetical protein SAMN02787099_02957 [Lysinibacillus fusiformis]
MARKWVLPLLLLLGALMAACSEDQKKAGDVEVTIPALFFEGQDIDSVISKAKNSGIKEIIKNDDGSLTYKMAKPEHEEMMKGLKEGILSNVDEIKASDDFKSVKDITYNKSFSEFTVSVNKKEFESSLDTMASVGLALTGMYYQLFNGADVENYKVTVIFNDESSGEVINTMVYPDVLNEKK